MLNIAGMPVYRDSVGGVGTPTSDNDRTKLSTDTCRLLMIINMYGPAEIDAAATEALARRLLEQYASATDIVVRHYRP